MRSCVDVAMDLRFTLKDALRGDNHLGTTGHAA